MRLLISLHLFALLFLFQNCAEQSFSSSSSNPSQNSQGGPGGTNGPSCREELLNVQTTVHMIFVVDRSGSNVISQGLPGTDPDKVARAGSLQAFLDFYKAKTNFTWSFLDFRNSTSSTALRAGSSTQMQSTINSFLNMGDGGNTPYLAALDNISQNVSFIRNLNSANQSDKYIVVFISDGKPDPAVEASIIQSEVQSILSIAPNQLSFNTVYYGFTDFAPADLLQSMAQVGQGRFLNASELPDKVFPIADSIAIPGQTCAN